MKIFIFVLISVVVFWYLNYINGFPINTRKIKESSIRLRVTREAEKKIDISKYPSLTEVVFEEYHQKKYQQYNNNNDYDEEEEEEFNTSTDDYEDEYDDNDDDDLINNGIDLLNCSNSDINNEKNVTIIDSVIDFTAIINFIILFFQSVYGLIFVISTTCIIRYFYYYLLRTEEEKNITNKRFNNKIDSNESLPVPPPPPSV
jgi:hypothetical protein